jgi:hypothetical protein
MRRSGRVLAWAVAFLILLPAATFSRDRDRWDHGRDSAYRAGYDDGFREGLRHGAFDFRSHYRYDFRGRDSHRWGGGSDWAFRFHGDYKKGYRDGYRQGYREGYRPHGYPNRIYPPRRGYPY